MAVLSIYLYALYEIISQNWFPRNLIFLVAVQIKYKLIERINYVQ